MQATTEDSRKIGGGATVNVVNVLTANAKFGPADSVCSAVSNPLRFLNRSISQTFGIMSPFALITIGPGGVQPGQMDGPRHGL